MTLFEQKNLHRFFTISVALTGVHAIFEIAGGIILYFISTKTIVEWVSALTQDELTEDPNALFSSYFLHAAQNLSIASKTFAVLYLLSHGIIKAALVLGLLRAKYWAYPASLFTLMLYILYQTHRFLITHSVAMLLLTIFDIVVMWLIWREYKTLRKY